MFLFSVNQPAPSGHATQVDHLGTRFSRKSFSLLPLTLQRSRWNSPPTTSVRTMQRQSVAWPILDKNCGIDHVGRVQSLTLEQPISGNWKIHPRKFPTLEQDQGCLFRECTTYTYSYWTRQEFTL